MKAWCIAATALLLAATLPAADKVDLPVKSYRLENGLQVVLAPRHDTPLIHSLVRYRVGSANEGPGITGISHLLEHMMFKGTKEFQTVNHELEQGPMQEQDQMFAEVLDLRQKMFMNQAPPDAEDRIKELQLRIKGLNTTLKIVTVQNDVDVATTQAGFSRLSADTSFDRTHYMEYFPSNCLEAWAYFESSRMKEPVFREFYSERDVVLEERRQTTETQPEGILLERFLPLAFSAHPYRWDVIGWRSDLENCTRADVSEYHRLYYAPNNAILVLVGDFPVEQAEALIRKYFGKIPAQAIAHPVCMTEEPPQLGEKRMALQAEGTPRLMVGYHRPAATHPDYLVLEFIDAILAGGRSGILYKDLTLTGKSVEFFTGLREMKRYPGLFTITALAGEGVPLPELEKILQDAVERLQSTPVSQRVLETARSSVTGATLRELGARDSLAVLLAEGQDFWGDPKAFNDRLKRLEEITAEDIQRVARKYFRPENRTVVLLAPPPPKQEGR